MPLSNPYATCNDGIAQRKPSVWLPVVAGKCEKTLGELANCWNFKIRRYARKYTSGSLLDSRGNFSERSGVLILDMPNN